MKTHVDLRCSRRLTVAEARLVTAVLAEHAAGRVAKSARAKIDAAIVLATHKCVGQKCVVCGEYPAASARSRKRRADDLQDRLAKSKAMQSKLEVDAKRDALFARRPNLKLTD